MKILFPYMARWSSAHASRYFHLLTTVAELGHEVYVLQPPSRYSGEANDIDVILREHPRVYVSTLSINRIFWNAHFPFEKLIKKMYYSIRSLSYIRKLIENEEIDLLYIYNLPQFLYLLGKHPKIVFDLADDLLGMLKSELSISSKHPVYRMAAFCLEWMFRRSNLIICISGPLFDKIKYPNKCLVPNGATFPDEYKIEKKQLKDIPHSMKIGYVGAFEYSMALDQIIEAAERLPEARFTLVGAGRDFFRIKKIIHERNIKNVTLTGAVSHDDAMKTISSMDVCLNLFNKTEVSDAVSPLKLFEYLSYKKPVISTHLMEVMRIDRNFLYYADTVDEIEARVRYISSHWEEAQEKANLGYQIVSKEYSWRNIAQIFLDAINSKSKEMNSNLINVKRNQ